MAVVVDASAIAAVVFGEVEGDILRRQLRGHALLAPSLIDYELTHVAWKKLRRSPSEGSAIFAALASVKHLGVRRAQPDAVSVLGVAAATGLTPYDASYLWLAQTTGLSLVTLDKRLAKAAEAL